LQVCGSVSLSFWLRKRYFVQIEDQGCWNESEISTLNIETALSLGSRSQLNLCLHYLCLEQKWNDYCNGSCADDSSWHKNGEEFHPSLPLSYDFISNLPISALISAKWGVVCMDGCLWSLTRRSDSLVWRFCLRSWTLNATYRLWKGKRVFFSRPTYLTATLSFKATVSLAQETGVPRSYSIVLFRLLPLFEEVGEVLAMIWLFWQLFGRQISML
jgi:hypothetical protein